MVSAGTRNSTPLLCPLLLSHFCLVWCSVMWVTVLSCSLSASFFRSRRTIWSRMGSLLLLRRDTLFSWWVYSLATVASSTTNSSQCHWTYLALATRPTKKDNSWERNIGLGLSKAQEYLQLHRRHRGNGSWRGKARIASTHSAMIRPGHRVRTIWPWPTTSKWRWVLYLGFYICALELWWRERIRYTSGRELCFGVKLSLASLCCLVFSAGWTY